VIALDTSSLMAFLSGEPGPDVELVERALGDHQACLPPVVLTELLSDPHLDRTVAARLGQLPLLGLSAGFWERAGRLRANVIARKRKARLAVALIAQCCLDHDLALVTRDRDFRNFAEVTPLRHLP
jgi:predicted nucleic acid-binding protein